MVQKVNDFNVIVVNSEFESLILENSLIKQHQPHYNILPGDDKGYPFIRLDKKAPYPRFTIVGSAKKGRSVILWPIRRTKRNARHNQRCLKGGGLSTCSKHFPRDIGKDRPCLNYHMGNCRGWCRGELSQE